MVPEFLTAEWRKLAIANYAVDPKLLSRYLPCRTELDCWNSDCYVSLVGFRFMNTRLKGVRIPFHIHFEEVNLRFYVRFKENGEWKRGVTFIREIVPRPAITWVANLFYREKYVTMPMQHTWTHSEDELEVAYSWKHGRQWQRFQVKTAGTPLPVLPDSEEEFITEHYWGYTRLGERRTSEYPVEHPRWEMYPVTNYNIQADFGKLYGDEFADLTGTEPRSVMLAEGSEIVVRHGRTIGT